MTRMVGVSPAWRRLVMQAEMVAAHLRMAVIEGENGVGKLTFAKYLHECSSLARTPFQRHDARRWLVTEADQDVLSGFIYLDRVDLLALPGQGLLLAMLKAMQDFPAGGAVLVASSQSSLRQMAARGLLMPDLAFRLLAVRFAVPPLRHRLEDIAPLAQVLIDRICERYQQRAVSLGPGVLARLLQHDWPGNVRELASVLEAALLETTDGVIRRENLQIFAGPDRPLTPQPVAMPETLNLDTVIRQHVSYVLDMNRGNKLRAARQLGISRSTLYRILDNAGEAR
jgi:DNA-binding NtrC family response regulator